MGRPFGSWHLALAAAAGLVVGVGITLMISGGISFYDECMIREMRAQAQAFYASVHAVCRARHPDSIPRSNWGMTRQVGADQIAAPVQRVRVTLRAVGHW